MNKSLYDLEPGDFWIDKKGSEIRAFSFVKEVTRQREYIVELEFLVFDGKRIVVYKFEGDQRKHDPIDWVSNPAYHELHPARHEEYTELIKMLFELELDTSNWEKPISDRKPNWSS